MDNHELPENFHYPNHVLAALQFLEERDLVEVVDRTDKRELKIYDITNRGRTVLEKLQPSDQ